MTSIVTRLRSQAIPVEYMEPTLLVERYSKERVEAANIIEALTAALAEMVPLVEAYKGIVISDHETSYGFSDYWYSELNKASAALALAKTHKGE